MRFQSIIGQKAVKQNLIHSVSEGRISHAQLFLGPEGSGNLALAIAYSQFINCLNPTENDSCGTCSSCVKYEKLVHPDLHFTFPIIAKEKSTSQNKVSNFYLEEWREALIQNIYLSDFDWFAVIDNELKKQGNITAEECRDIFRKLSLKAYEAKYKTLILWMPEYLKNEGNILLKLLEEPPENTLIILVASDTSRILPTILSRVQLLKIPKLKDEEIQETLIQNYALDKSQAANISRIADGDLNQSLKLMDAHQISYNEIFVEWFRECFAANKQFGPINKRAEIIASMGKETIKSFLAYCNQMVRAAFIFKYGNRNNLRIAENEILFFEKFSPLMNAYSIEELERSFNEAIIEVERNANVKILIYRLSLYIGSLLQKKV